MCGRDPPGVYVPGPRALEGTEPVNKKLAAALSGAAVLVVTLSACSDDGESKANAWAKQVCDKVQPQRKKIDAANASMKSLSSEKDKPADVRNTDLAAFQSTSDAFGALATAVEQAGPPPSDEGGKKQKQLVSELKATSASYADLRKTVEGFDIKDQAKFADSLFDLSGKMLTDGQSADRVLAKLQTGTVEKATADQAGCRPPKPSAGTGSASPTA